MTLNKVESKGRQWRLPLEIAEGTAYESMHLPTDSCIKPFKIRSEIQIHQNDWINLQYGLARLSSLHLSSLKWKYNQPFKYWLERENQKRNLKTMNQPLFMNHVRRFMSRGCELAKQAIGWQLRATGVFSLRPAASGHFFHFDKLLFWTNTWSVFNTNQLLNANGVRTCVCSDSVTDGWRQVLL